MLSHNKKIDIYTHYDIHNIYKSSFLRRVVLGSGGHDRRKYIKNFRICRPPVECNRLLFIFLQRSYLIVWVCRPYYRSTVFPIHIKELQVLQLRNFIQFVRLRPIICQLNLKTYVTSLKKKLENNSTWEDAFYQSEWVKINTNWVILVFSLYVYCY